MQADASLNTMAIVERSLERQTPEQMARVAQMLLEAGNVYLTAVRASYAMAYYFHYVGRMALPSLQLIPRHMNSAIDELNYASDRDVMIAVSFTPYSRETVEACLRLIDPSSPSWLLVLSPDPRAASPCGQTAYRGSPGRDFLETHACPI